MFSLVEMQEDDRPQITKSVTKKKSVDGDPKTLTAPCVINSTRSCNITLFPVHQSVPCHCSVKYAVHNIHVRGAHSKDLIIMLSQIAHLHTVFPSLYFHRKQLASLTSNPVRFFTKNGMVS